MTNRLLAAMKRLILVVPGLAWVLPGAAQVDSARARAYLREATVLCEREGGRLWGTSLCGPIAIADAPTNTLVTSEAAPSAPRPPTLGYANSAMQWGERRWSTLVWGMIPADNPRARGILILHELFHRIQPQLGFQLNDGSNEHLDTLDGRYWLQLEWRALARALNRRGEARAAALADALAFRTHRRVLFAGAADDERRMEINEALAQYTGLAAGAASREEAVEAAIEMLASYERQLTFVRTFPYPMAAYGLLLDEYAAGWTRTFMVEDDLGDKLALAAGVVPARDVEGAATRYGGAELRVAEVRRDSAQRVRLAELRARFVEGPVVVIPNGRMNSFLTAGMTVLPGEGTVYPGFRTTGEWGSLEADWVLMAADWSMLRVPAPFQVDGAALKGDGWRLAPAPGWIVKPGARLGDFRLVREGGG